MIEIILQLLIKLIKLTDCLKVSFFSATPVQTHTHYTPAFIGARELSAHTHTHIIFQLLLVLRNYQ